MFRNLLFAAVVIAMLALGMGAFLLRSERASTVPRLSDPALPSRDAPPTRAPSADAALAALARASQPLMPERYEMLYLGMPLEELRRMRPRVANDPQARGRGGAVVWEEDDARGTHVVYLVDPRSQRLRQAQFASIMHSGDEVRPHFEAMTRRFGQPTAVWDCPQVANTAPTRRFIWGRQVASVMEAMLVYQTNIAVTLMVTPNEAIVDALSHLQCRAVRTPEQFASLPVAMSVPGDAHPMPRELPLEDEPIGPPARPGSDASH